MFKSVVQCPQSTCTHTHKHTHTHIYIYIYNFNQDSSSLSCCAASTDFLTLFHHLSLSSIASGTSSRQHLMSVQSCCRKFLLVGQHLHSHIKGSTCLSLLLQQCPTYLVCLTWMVLEMGGRWLHNCCFVGCCFQDFFNIAHNILAQFPSSSFSLRLVYVVPPYSRIDMTAAWKKLCLFLSDRFDFHIINNLLIAVHAIARCILMSFSVDEMLLLRYVNLSTNFREPQLSKYCDFIFDYRIPV